MGSAKRQKTSARAEESHEDSFIKSISDAHAAAEPAEGEERTDISVMRNNRVRNIVQIFNRVNRYPMEEAVARRNALSVPTLSSSHIANLLYEPYTRLTVSGSHKVCPPACVRGDACIGRSPDITGLRQGSPGPLCAWMSQYEWDEMNTSGSVPSEPRRCVLCVLYGVQMEYNKARLIAPRDVLLGEDTFVPYNMQPFCVRVDEPGGYKSKYCIPFSNDSCALGLTGLMCPIPMTQLSLLENRYSSSGTRYICQRRLLHEYDDSQVQYF